MSELRTLISKKGGFKSTEGDYQIEIFNADL